MSGLGEVLVAIFSFLIEVTIYLAALSCGPVRYFFSSKYRATQQQRWKGHPVRCAFEVIGSSVMLIFFVGMMWWWVMILLVPKPPPTATEQMEERLGRNMFELLRPKH